MKSVNFSELADRLSALHQATIEQCPECAGSSMRGHIRGWRCSNCNASGEVDNPNYDPSIQREVVALLRQLAEPAKLPPIPPDLNDHTKRLMRAYAISALAQYGIRMSRTIPRREPDINYIIENDYFDDNDYME